MGPLDSASFESEASESTVQKQTQRNGVNDRRRAVATEIALDKILRNPDQPRKYFDQLDHKWLAESIAKHGVLQPVLVRAVGDEEFMIVAGERRWRAAEAAGLTSIPAVVVGQEHAPLDDVDTQALALMENLQRRDLNDYEVAVGVTEYVRRRLGFAATDEVVKFLRRMHNKTVRADEQGLAARAESIFRELGRSYSSFVAHQLSALSLRPEVQQHLRMGKIDLSKALVINRIEDDELREHFLWSTSAHGWTRAQLRREVADILAGRIGNQQQESQRASIGRSMTEVRKRFAKNRRQLSDAVIAEIDQLVARLNELVDPSAPDISEKSAPM